MSRLPAIWGLPSIGPNQKQTMGIDFGDFLPTGITLTGTPVATLSSSNSSDPNPQGRVVSGPTIGTISTALGGTGLANTGITIQVDDCIPGVQYILDIYCSRSDGDIAEASTRFSCNAPS